MVPMDTKQGGFDFLEQANTVTENLWKGTFREFLQLYESGEYTTIGALAHERIYKMILAAGVTEKDYFGTKRKSYAFFENELYGVEDTVDNIMSYLHSAAEGMQTSKRMLLLFGPVSTGKSECATLLKRGLEQFSLTKEGAVFAISGSAMHENPFLLVPNYLRKEFEDKYHLKIEGELSPPTRFRLDKEFNGRFMDFPVQRIYLSEASRVGIGTYVPGDPKSADQSDLVGGIDFAKIQEVGDEADPRAYNFNGELNIANRGMMEFVEGLKADEKFIRVLLTATQEKSIKAPRFGLVYTDTFILLHTNETEFINFMNEKKYEAYHDRMVIVKVPYNMSVSNEIKIYEKLLMSSKNMKAIHIAPHTLYVAAMFSIMTRLEPPKDGDMTLVKKMKLYNQQHVKGHKIEQVPDMKKKCPREGMFGVSPRFVIDQISTAISKAKDEGRDFITPLDVLRQINLGVHSRDTFKSEDKNAYERHIEAARQEWNELLRSDIQKAFFLSYEDEARNLFENYLDQIEAACSGQKPRDPVTHEETELDEKLMDSIEQQLNITDSGKDDFRNEILRFVGAAVRKNQTFDYTKHAHLKEAIQKQLFEERKGVIRMTVSTRNPDQDAVRRLNEVVDRMVKDQGYTAKSANELLKYATAHLFDK